MAVCKDCEHYKVCLVHCSESVLRNRGICEHFKNGWFSVSDRLPEDDENLRFYDDGQLRFTSVLVHDENRGTAIANRLMIRHHSMPVFDELATDGWVWSRPYEPTHWMPLPELPKEG